MHSVYFNVDVGLINPPFKVNKVNKVWIGGIGDHIPLIKMMMEYTLAAQIAAGKDEKSKHNDQK